MSGTPPNTLGKYQIIREIARSNDIVYEAYDSLMNRRVALKELAVPGGTTDQQREDRVKRFLREARAAGSLAHPNIMTVYEVGQEGDRYFIAMEYLDGKTLRNEIDAKGFLPAERAVEIAIQVLEGLEYAHSKGVIHRDIKPDNIQILSSGVIKLTDFGIARLTFEPNITMDGQVFGTPSYMSPEQVVGREIDARSDLFSLGVVLYEMMAGVKPFTGDSVVTITYGIMNKNPDRPQQINWALWQVIEKALDKSPQLRHRSAAEFIEDLKNALSNSQGVVMDAGSTQTGYPTLAPPTPIPLYTGYGGATPPPVIQQQPQAPQNPYQMPAAQAQFGYGSTAGPGPVSVPPAYGMQMPIYYPPPPRKPLIRLSPQTKHMLVQIFVYCVALAALVGVFMFTLNAAQRVVDDRVVNSARKGPNGKPVDPAISWNERGAADMNAGNLDDAEADFQEAIRLSPQFAASYSALGELLVTRASREVQPSGRREYMRRAAESFKQAGVLEKDTSARDDANRRGAESYLNLAIQYMEAGDKSLARQQLYNAKELAHADPSLMMQIDRTLASLSD